MIEVRRATGFATVQDLGWPTGRAIGLPQSGAIDRASFSVANALVGNDTEATIEVAIGGLDLVFERPAIVAARGAGAPLRLDGSALPLDATVAVPGGGHLTIGPIEAGRFLYLAIDGGIDVPMVMGARATYLPTGLGGWQGRRLATGDRIPLGPARRHAPAPGTTIPRVPDDDRPIRIAPGPQSHLFRADVLAELERGVYHVAPASDRMGTRLVGPAIKPEVPALLPSEAACLGAIQVPDDGQPIAILADGPTVGGYPKVAVIAGSDLDRFGQVRLGGSVRLSWTSVAEAQRSLHESHADLTGLLGEIRRQYRAR